MQTELPGVLALIKQGIEIYKQVYKPILRLLLLNYLVILGAVIVGGIAFVLGMVLKSFIPLPLLIVIGVLIGLVLLVVLMWIGLRSFVSILFAVRDHATSPTFKIAWNQSKGHVAPYLVIMLLGALWVLGPAVCVAAIAFLLGFFTGFSFAVSMATIFGFTALIVSGIVIGTRIAFSQWIFIDRGTHGVAALHESSAMVKGRFATVFWKLVGVGLIAWVLQFILGFVLGLATYAFGDTGKFLGEAITTIIYQFTIYPVALGAIFTFYLALKVQQPTSFTE